MSSSSNNKENVGVSGNSSPSSTTAKLTKVTLDSVKKYRAKAPPPKMTHLQVLRKMDITAFKLSSYSNKVPSFYQQGKTKQRQVKEMFTEAIHNAGNSLVAQYPGLSFSNMPAMDSEFYVMKITVQYFAIENGLAEKLTYLKAEEEVRKKLRVRIKNIKNDTKRKEERKMSPGVFNNQYIKPQNLQRALEGIEDDGTLFKGAFANVFFHKSDDEKLPDEYKTAYAVKVEALPGETLILPDKSKIVVDQHHIIVRLYQIYGFVKTAFPDDEHPACTVEHKDGKGSCVQLRNQNGEFVNVLKGSLKLDDRVDEDGKGGVLLKVLKNMVNRKMAPVNTQCRRRLNSSIKDEDLDLDKADPPEIISQNVDAELEEGLMGFITDGAMQQEDQFKLKEKEWQKQMQHERQQIQQEKEEFEREKQEILREIKQFRVEWKERKSSEKHMQTSVIKCTNDDFLADRKEEQDQHASPPAAVSPSDKPAAVSDNAASPPDKAAKSSTPPSKQSDASKTLSSTKRRRSSSNYQHVDKSAVRNLSLADESDNLRSSNGSKKNQTADPNRPDTPKPHTRAQLGAIKRSRRFAN